MVKRKVTITLNGSLLEWVQEKIKRKEFGSVSHAIEKALFDMREREKEEKE